MNKLLKASIKCLSNTKMQDNTHEVARDIVLNALTELHGRIDKAIEYTKSHTDKLKTIRVPKIDFDYNELLEILKGEDNE